MNAGVVGQPDPIQQGSRFMAARVVNRFPASADGQSRSVSGTDSVDLASVGSIGKALKMLNEQESLPIPEAVGRAIRALVQEVLNKLPGSGRVFG
ncbi:MAG: hypothetical protein H7837_03460 [Magnetococcus sp. MYC-9]